MPIFIIQGRYSREALRGMLAKPEDRAEAVSKLAEAAGGKLLSYYVTFGEDDFHVTLELPSHKEAAALAVTVGASGGVASSRTIVAMTTAEAKEILTAAGDLGGAYRPPGTA
jgi:uncharacterized protein with GYD domain